MRSSSPFCFLFRTLSYLGPPLDHGWCHLVFSFSWQHGPLLVPELCVPAAPQTRLATRPAIFVPSTPTVSIACQPLQLFRIITVSPLKRPGGSKNSSRPLRWPLLVLEEGSNTRSFSSQGSCRGISPTHYGLRGPQPPLCHMDGGHATPIMYTAWTPTRGGSSSSPLPGSGKPSTHSSHRTPPGALLWTSSNHPATRTHGDHIAMILYETPRPDDHGQSASRAWHSHPAGRPLPAWAYLCRRFQTPLRSHLHLGTDISVPWPCPSLCWGLPQVPPQQSLVPWGRPEVAWLHTLIPKLADSSKATCMQVAHHRNINTWMGFKPIYNKGSPHCSQTLPKNLFMVCYSHLQNGPRRQVYGGYHLKVDGWTSTNIPWTPCPTL